MNRLKLFSEIEYPEKFDSLDFYGFGPGIFMKGGGGGSSGEVSFPDHMRIQQTEWFDWINNILAPYVDETDPDYGLGSPYYEAQTTAWGSFEGVAFDPSTEVTTMSAATCDFYNVVAAIDPEGDNEDFADKAILTHGNISDGFSSTSFDPTSKEDVSSVYGANSAFTINDPDLYTEVVNQAYFSEVPLTDAAHIIEVQATLTDINPEGAELSTCKWDAPPEIPDNITSAIDSSDNDWIDPTPTAPMDISTAWVDPSPNSPADITGGWVDPTPAAAAAISAAVSDYAANQEDVLENQTRPRFENGLRDIGASFTSAFTLGNALLDAFSQRDIARFESELRQQAFLQADRIDADNLTAANSNVAEAHRLVDQINAENRLGENQAIANALINADRIEGDFNSARGGGLNVLHNRTIEWFIERGRSLTGAHLNDTGLIANKTIGDDRTVVQSMDAVKERGTRGLLQTNDAYLGAQREAYNARHTRTLDGSKAYAVAGQNEDQIGWSATKLLNQQTLQEELSKRAEMLQLMAMIYSSQQLRVSSMGQSTHYTLEGSRIQVIVQSEQVVKDMEIARADVKWDFELFTHASNLMASIQGGTYQPGDDKGNPVMSAAGGAVSGAAAGAMIGAQYGAGGGPYGAIIGAVVGGLGGLLSG